MLLSLRHGWSVARGQSGELLLQGAEGHLALTRLEPTICRALEELAQGATGEEELIDKVLGAGGSAARAELYYYLERLVQQGIVVRSAHLDGTLLATLTSISNLLGSSNTAIQREGRYALSRFAYMRRLQGQMVLESPLSHARVTLHDWRATACVHLLRGSCHATDLATQIPGVTEDAAKQMLTLLVNSGLAGTVDDDDGRQDEERDGSLQMWEFHDLLFHARSRTGRHDYPVGGTYPFLGAIDPPPALKPASQGEIFELYRPDLDRLQREDPPFAAVQEARRSVRVYGEPPVNARELGEFLFRVARVRTRETHQMPTPRGPVRTDYALRPYPNGGGLYELELYVIVNARTDLPRGLSHYDPLAHRLEIISGLTPETQQLVQDAGAAATIPPEDVQLLLIVAARFPRIAWKYSSIAYAATLKHVGVLYQTMYLVATAMDLAPCAVGGGNADLFARASGSDYYEETSVGEFLLGTRRAAERRSDGAKGAT